MLNYPKLSVKLQRSLRQPHPLAWRSFKEKRMAPTTCIVLGAPVQEGAGRLGCDMGPSAFRTAGLVTELRNLGYAVEDRGNIAPAPLRELRHPNGAIKALPETVAWTEA